MKMVTTKVRMVTTEVTTEATEHTSDHDLKHKDMKQRGQEVNTS